MEALIKDALVILFLIALVGLACEWCERREQQRDRERGFTPHRKTHTSHHEAQP